MAAESVPMTKVVPRDDTPASDSDDEDEDLGYTPRPKWANQMEFVLSLVGYAVGVGNIWRFPYLCMRNGGGAFLIPYFFFLLTCGLPLYYMEICIGQFSGTSALTVWKICPLFKGIGISMTVVSGLTSVYYNMLIAWVLYYMASSFASDLPWSSCDHWWNSITCSDTRSGLNNITNINSTALSYFNGTSGFNYTHLDDGANSVILSKRLGRNFSAAEEYWQYNVLDVSPGLDHPGGIRWQLALSLLVAWVAVYLCLIKGVRSVGKVVYITAVLPYIILTVFLIRGVTLPGAVSGIMFYLTPDFSRLLDYNVWIEACLQVFFSLGPAWGGLITMSSYNKFHNNCLRDSIIGTVADALTSFYAGFVIFSVLGFMAHEANVHISKVVTSGPGLAFVAYPEAITKLPIPQVWAVLFFLMLFTLGLDSQFAMFETLCSGLVDVFPRQLTKWKSLLTASLAVLAFTLGLPLTTRGGVYVFQLMDWYVPAFTVLLVSFLECMVIGWIYGADRLSRDIELMLGKKPFVVLRLCWCIVTPVLMLAAFVCTLITYAPPKYGDYEYPDWARSIGWLLSMVSIIPIPVVMCTELYKSQGTLSQRFGNLLKPAKDWGPSMRHYRETYSAENKHIKTGFLHVLKANLFGISRHTGGHNCFQH